MIQVLAKTSSFYLFKFFNVYSFLREREKQRMRGRGAEREREGDTESEAGFKL